MQKIVLTPFLFQYSNNMIEFLLFDIPIPFFQERITTIVQFCNRTEKSQVKSINCVCSSWLRDYDLSFPFHGSLKSPVTCFSASSVFFTSFLSIQELTTMTLSKIFSFPSYQKSCDWRRLFHWRHAQEGTKCWSSVHRDKRWIPTHPGLIRILTVVAGMSTTSRWTRVCTKEGMWTCFLSCLLDLPEEPERATTTFEDCTGTRLRQPYVQKLCDMLELRWIALVVSQRESRHVISVFLWPETWDLGLVQLSQALAYRSGREPYRLCVFSLICNRIRSSSSDSLRVVETSWLA